MRSSQLDTEPNDVPLRIIEARDRDTPVVVVVSAHRLSRTGLLVSEPNSGSSQASYYVLASEQRGYGDSVSSGCGRSLHRP